MENFDAIQEMVDWLKEVSPLVWEATVRQVYAEAVAGLVWSAILFIFSTVLVFLSKFLFERYSKESEESEFPDPGWIISSIFSMIAGISMFFGAGSFLTEAIQMFYAPEYHAIRLLLETFKP